MATRRKTKPKRKNSFVRILTRALLWFFAITILWVLAYRFIDPPVTWLMVARDFEHKSGDSDRKQTWLSLDELSSNIKKAAIAGEDANFLTHNGFDFKAIEMAYAKNQAGKKMRGGSTISQQTAKNVFLWPGRSYVRKAFEAYFTILIELLWGKERILEVYLNVIETGDRIYGVDSAAREYYGKSAEKLTKRQAALLIAVLPNPRRWSPAKPTRYIYYKQSLILRNMRQIGDLAI